MSRRTLLLAVLLLAALPSVADAEPRKRMERVRLGFVAAVAGTGCSPATLERPSHARAVTWTEPAIGDGVGALDLIDVTSTGADGSRIWWTVEPAAVECRLHEEEPGWAWRTEERAWSAIYRDRRHAIESSRLGGVRSIAGVRTSPRGRRSRPTIGRARRKLGRPTSVRRGRGSARISCRVTWRRLGLRLMFMNLGGAHPCRRGLAQAGSVRGPRAAEWAAMIGREPGVIPGTEAAFLDEELIGERDRSGRRRWTLAEVWVPYGDSGFIPSVSALLDRERRVSGFAFWIGAAGD